METTIDPLCGRPIVPAATTPQSEYQGKIYYFCCELCKQLFDREPQKHVAEKEKQATGRQLTRPQSKIRFRVWHRLAFYF